MSEFQVPEQHPAHDGPIREAVQPPEVDGAAGVEGADAAAGSALPATGGYGVHDGVWTWSDAAGGAAQAVPTDPPVFHGSSLPTQNPLYQQGTARTEPLNYGPGPGYGEAGSPSGYPPTQAYWPAGSAGAASGSTSPLSAGGVPTGTATRPRRLRTALIGTAVLAALVGGGAGAATVAIADNHSSTTVASGLSTTNSSAPVAAITNGTISAAAARIKPSVVTIQVKGTSESGTGSGVVLRSDGYILTNDHVVSVAATGGSILVQLEDGRSAKATIVGRDTTDDLAVIKVTGVTNLAAATFANSAALTAGQTVVAVGAPLGLSDTVTAGIVSATARTVRSGDQNQAVFAAVQTDAAINPGNSGGALVDLNGDVIGINSAIASTSQESQSTSQSGNIGIGFAIPSNEASRVAAELISTGKATHALLGVTLSATQSVTSTGAIVKSVNPGGAADKAGLKAGDVVTAVDGARISDGDDLIAAIHSHTIKDTVTVTYTRAGASHKVKATLTAGTN